MASGFSRTRQAIRPPRTFSSGNRRFHAINPQPRHLSPLTPQNIPAARRSHTPPALHGNPAGHGETAERYLRLLYRGQGLTLADLQLQYTTYKNALQQLAQKIGDVEQEAEEHKLVLETLAPVPRDRKCFRLINGVLVERTVSDVVPALQTNADGLKTVLEGLVKEYRKKQEEMDTWKTKNNVQVVNQ